MQFSLISGFFDTLGKAQKAYTRHLEPVCRKWELTRSELDVLLFLYNHPQYHRAADIVEHRGMAKSHVSLSVANLEQRGLLERTFPETDRRTANLHLTGAGTIIAQEGSVQQQLFFTRLYGDVSPAEMAQWEAIAAKIRNNVENLNITETNV